MGRPKRQFCGKRRHRTELDARLHMVRARSRRNDGGKVESRVYRCPRCKGWHVTSQG